MLTSEHEDTTDELPPVIEAAVRAHVDSLSPAERQSFAREQVRASVKQRCNEILLASAILALERGEVEAAYSKLRVAVDYFIEDGEATLERVRATPHQFRELDASTYRLPAAN